MSNECTTCGHASPHKKMGDFRDNMGFKHNDQCEECECINDPRWQQPATSAPAPKLRMMQLLEENIAVPQMLASDLLPIAEADQADYAAAIAEIDAIAVDLKRAHGNYDAMKAERDAALESRATIGRVMDELREERDLLAAELDEAREYTNKARNECDRRCEMFAQLQLTSEERERVTSIERNKLAAALRETGCAKCRRYESHAYHDKRNFLRIDAFHGYQDPVIAALSASEKENE